MKENDKPRTDKNQDVQAVLTIGWGGDGVLPRPKKNSKK
jgi:hypothetical protein